MQAQGSHLGANQLKRRTRPQSSVRFAPTSGLFLYESMHSIFPGVTAIGDVHMQVLDVPITSVDTDQLLESYDSGLLLFHNLDTMYKTCCDETFRAVCCTADYAAIDGQVLRGLLRVLWHRDVSKVSGADFLPAFCRHHASNPDVKLFLLGAGPGVAERAGQRLNATAGRQIVVGAHSPSFDLLTDEQESARVAEMINTSGANALAVGLGAPKQELWMSRNRSRMPNVARFMAVGATLDFEAGRVRRAPRWMSTMGLEWLFRLVHEPRRLWRRYLVEGPRVVVALMGSRPSAGRHRKPPIPRYR